MNILVVGNGGRGTLSYGNYHRVKKPPWYHSSGETPGTGANFADNVNINSTDIEGLTAFAKDKHIELAVIGPETPLSQGIIDRFQALGIPAFGTG